MRKLRYASLNRSNVDVINVSAFWIVMRNTFNQLAMVFACLNMGLIDTSHEQWYCYHKASTLSGVGGIYV